MTWDLTARPTCSIPSPEDVPSPLSFSLPLGAQILANVFLYLCAIIVGVMSYYMADRKHRKAFLEARQSLEVKMNLEEQSQQQVSLPASRGSFGVAFGESGLEPRFRDRDWGGGAPREGLSPVQYGAHGAPWGLVSQFFPRASLRVIPLLPLSATASYSMAHSHCTPTVCSELLSLQRGTHPWFRGLLWVKSISRSPLRPGALVSFTLEAISPLP